MNIKKVNIKKISILNELELLIELTNGEYKVFNISKYLQGEAFKPLKNIKEFKKFKLEFGCLEWECGASLSEDTLLSNSSECAKSN